MTVDIQLAGSSLTPAGRQIWVSAATVTEDATAVNLADTFGGVGSIDVTTDTLDNTMLLQGAQITLTYSDGGVREGIIESISDNDGQSQITGTTNERKLNRTISTTPVTTTLGDALKQYFQKCGLSSAQYSIDSGIASRTLTLPGWNANCWEMLKQLASVEQFDIGEIAGVVTVSPRGQHSIDISNTSTAPLSLSENISGRQVETYYYTHTKITNQRIYPPDTYDDTYGSTLQGGWSKDLSILTVTPGTPTVVEAPVMASLSSVQQPICVKLIGRNYTGPSAYTVMMNNGVETIDPGVWTRLGGKITVEILPDTQNIRITVDAGENLMAGAPYRICVSDGTDFSTLRINGSGIRTQKTRLRMPTSTPSWLTDTDIAVSTDCIFVRTQDQARRILTDQAAAVSRSVSALSATLGEIPLSFGTRAGALIRRPEAVYRVRSCSTSAGGSQLQADRYTTIADFNAAWTGKTIADFNAVWAGYQFRNLDVMPLVTSLPAPPQIPMLSGYGFDPYSTSPYGG